MNARNKRSIIVCLICVGLGLAASTLAGQEAPRTFVVKGVAFDSLTNRPLVGATIRIFGRADSTLSDAAGKFHFDSVEAGTRLLSMEHADIDAIGLSDISSKVDFAKQRSDVVLAIPSFKTLWRGVCGGQQAPTDSGFLYGAIRDARTQNGVAGARVSVSWTDVGLSANKKLKTTRFTLETQSDSLGAYVACGVPVDVPLVINAVTATDTLIALELPATAMRVQKRDISMGLAIAVGLSVGSADSARVRAGVADTLSANTTAKLTTARAGGASLNSEFTGDIEGVITNATGGALAQVIISVAGGYETRSDSSGKFSLKNVPIGTRTVQFAAIGALPISRIVDVTSDAAANVSVKMERVNTLENVKVTATRVSSALRSFEERKRTGFGYIQDSTEVARTVTMTAMIRGFPSVIVAKRGAPIVLRNCAATIFINGQRADVSDFWALNVDELAWVEVYPRRISVPSDFQSTRGCGVVAVFTKQFIQR